MKFFDKSSIHYYNLRSLQNSSAFFSSVVSGLPTKQDTIYGAVAKYISVGNKLVSEVVGVNSLPPEMVVIQKSVGDFIYEFIQNLGIQPDEILETKEGGKVRAGTYRYSIDGSYYYLVKVDEWRGLKPYLHGHSGDTDVTSLFRKLWGRVGKSLYVGEELIRWERKKIIRPIGGFGCGAIYGKVLGFLDDLVEDHRKYSEMGLPRSYLLVGDPGVGKTTLICEFVERIGGRCIFTSLENDDPYAYAGFFATLGPDVIVFDDCDRGGDAGMIRKQLKFIEEVKKALPSSIIFMVANKFDGALKDEAFTRKGRLDKIYEIPRPEEDDIKEIFVKYLQSFGVVLSSEDFSYAIGKMIKYSGAEIYAVVQELTVGVGVREYFEYEESVAAIRKKYEVVVATAEVKK